MIYPQPPDKYLNQTGTFPVSNLFTNIKTCTNSFAEIQTTRCLCSRSALRLSKQTMKEEELLTDVQSYTEDASNMNLGIDVSKQRFPSCLVWTPIPILSYFIPIIGHIGIATSIGVIRDFAGPYHVSEDNFAFGRPTKYIQLNSGLAKGGAQGWDSAVAEASDIYKTRMHNLFCDNCHSYVALALNLMSYENSNNWNMLKLAVYIFVFGKYVSFTGFLKTWLPFCLIVTAATLICIFTTKHI